MLPLSGTFQLGLNILLESICVLDYFDKMEIPSEIIITIFKYLNKKDLMCAIMTCKRFYNAG